MYPESLHPNPEPAAKRPDACPGRDGLPLGEGQAAAARHRRCDLGPRDLQLARDTAAPVARVGAPELDLVQDDEDEQEEEL